MAIDKKITLANYWDVYHFLGLSIPADGTLKDPYPGSIGQKIQLSDGRIATIKRTGQGDRYRKPKWWFKYFMSN